MAGKVNPVQSYQEATNQLLAINEQRKSALQQAKMEESLQAARNNTLAQASEFVASQPQQGNVQAANLNPATQNILGQYGLGQPRIQKSSSSSQTVTKQNIVINNKNTNITNNNVSVPANVGGPIQGRPVQFQDPGQIKFKTWLSNSFAQQEELAGKRQREYEKRDSALVRNSNKLMKKLEDMGKTVATSLNPKNMASNMTNQLKTLFMVLGFGYIARNWPRMLDKINDIQTSISGFFTDGGTLVKMLGGKESESVFTAFKNLFLDEKEGILSYVRRWIGDKIEERGSAIKNIPKPDLSPDGKLDIGGNISKFLTGILTYLGNILTTIVNPKAGLERVAEQSIREENYNNTNNYYYNNQQKFSTGKTQLRDGEGNLVMVNGKSKVEYEDTAGGLFKENGYKGILPGSVEKSSDKLINTPQIEGELSQGMDVARNIKAASKKGGNRINTADVAAGLRRLNLKAHESGYVYLDEESLLSMGADPRLIGAEKIKGKYIVVPRSEDLKNLDYQATLQQYGGRNSSVMAGVDTWKNQSFWQKLSDPFKSTRATIGNEGYKALAKNETEDYHTILIDENELESIKAYLSAKGTPFSVLDKEQENIYKISETQMRNITKNLGINLGSEKDIASDLSLSNREYVDAVTKYLENKIDKEYKDSKEYQDYLAYSSFDPTKVIESTKQQALDQLSNTRKVIAGSTESLNIANMSLEQAEAELRKEHENLQKRIANRDLKEGETLGSLYEEDNKILEILQKIEGLYESDENGNRQIRKEFQKVEPPKKPTIHRDNSSTYFEGLDEYNDLVNQHDKEHKEAWENTRAHEGAEYTGSLLNKAKNKVSRVIKAKDVQKVSPSNIDSGDLTGVIAASKRGVFYSNSSGGYIPLGNGIDPKEFKHKCTSGPSTFYYDGTGGKINMFDPKIWWDTGSPKTATGTNIGKVGFKPVWTGTYEQGWDTNSIRATGFELQPGDIMLNFGKTSSHAQMWNGEEWISDTRQGSRSFVYRSGGRLGDKSAQIWRYDSKTEKSGIDLASSNSESPSGIEVSDIAFGNETSNSVLPENLTSTTPTSQENLVPFLSGNRLGSLFNRTATPTFTPEKTMADNFPSLSNNKSKETDIKKETKSKTPDYTAAINGIGADTNTELQLLQTGFSGISQQLDEIKSGMAMIGKKSGGNSTPYVPTAPNMTEGHFNSLYNS